MPYLKGKFKGELKAAEIRKIVRLHNELSKIKIPPRLTRDELIKFINKNGYKVDHENEKIVMTKNVKKDFTLSEAQDKFPKVKRVKKVSAKVTPKMEKEDEVSPVDKDVPTITPKPEAPKAEAPKESFKVKATDRKKMNNQYSLKYDKTIYQVLKPFGIGSEKVAKTISPSELKKIAKKIRLKTHPDKPGGNADDFDRLNSAIKVLLDTIVVGKAPAPAPAPKPAPAPAPAPAPKKAAAIKVTTKAKKTIELEPTKSDFKGELRKLSDATKPGSDWAKQMKKAKTIKDIQALMKVYTKLSNAVSEVVETDEQETKFDTYDSIVRKFRDNLIERLPVVSTTNPIDKKKYQFTDMKSLEAYMKRLKQEVSKLVADKKVTGSKQIKYEDYVDIRVPQLIKDLKKKLK